MSWVCIFTRRETNLRQGYYYFIQSTIRYQKEFQRGLAFTIFIRIWVTFETVELTKGKACRSQVKSVKIWTWQGTNEGTAAAWEKEGWTGILVIFKAIWHYSSVWTDWYLIRQGTNPVKGTRLSGAAASCKAHRNWVSSISADRHGWAWHLESKEWRLTGTQTAYLLYALHFWRKYTKKDPLVSEWKA